MINKENHGDVKAVIKNVQVDPFHQGCYYFRFISFFKRIYPL